MNKAILLIIFYAISLKIRYLAFLSFIEEKFFLDFNGKCSSILIFGGRDNYDRVLKGLVVSQYNNSSIIIFNILHKNYLKKINAFKMKKNIYENNSTNTYMYIFFLKKNLFNNTISNICLATSESHIYKAKIVFKRFKLKIKPIIFNIVSKNEIRIKDFFSDFKYFKLNIDLFYEYLAIVFYKIKKRI